VPAILQSSQFSYLAIANPSHAPYGQAAVETLQNLSLYNKVSSRLVQGENIAQTYQFVQTANAQLGFIALSQIMSEGKIKSGSYWLVPTEMHSPIRQNAVLLSTAKHNPQALALLAYLKSEKVKAIIQSYGYKI
jgi:molybdate transport system substrate-binding protein